MEGRRGRSLSPPRSRKHRKRTRSDSGSSSSSPTTSRSSSSDSDDHSSGDERRRHRHRKHRDRRSHSKKKGEKKSKKNDKKGRKQDRDSDSDESDRKRKKRLLKEAKKLLRRTKSNADHPTDHAKKISVEQLTERDYYSKNNEFALWLMEDRRSYFSALSSEEAHNLFSEFVKAWNTGSLDTKYYEGIKSAPRTSHKWKIKGGEAVDVEEDWVEKKKQEKLERKRFQKEHEVVLDELLPKATGRERLMEKKAIKREKNRARDDSPEHKERDIMGGGDDFQQRLARERSRREKKAAAKFEAFQEKYSAVQAKESAAMDQLRALVDSAGGKIEIRRRD